MREHIKADEPFERSEMTAQDAIELFRERGQDYKVELIEDLVRDHGHRPRLVLPQRPVPRPLPRPARADHRAHRRVQAAVARRRLLARRLQPPDAHPRLRHGVLREEGARRAPRAPRAGARRATTAGSARSSACSRSPRSRPAPTFWLPKGTALFNALVALNRRMQPERGYVEVKTPQLYESQPVGDQRATGASTRRTSSSASTRTASSALKPMNCPGHCHLFGLQRWSYRDLPLRCAEPGLLHRREPSGTLHGLLRVRHFCQDDAHIFCREDQIQDEVTQLPGLRATRSTALFGFPVQLELSTRPDDRLGDDAFWDHAEGGARGGAAQTAAIEYTIGEGEGAFYAPKIDLHMTDSLGRSWQLGTVQLDYNLPERFGLTYTGADNAEHTPVMIHRALFGSFERFIGILLEHTAGELPLWLAPVQAIALPIADRHNDAAQAAADRAARRRPARRGRRPHRVGRAQDPRRRAAEDPVHARRRRPRGRGGHGRRAPPWRGRSGHGRRSTSSSSGWPPSRSRPRSAGAARQSATAGDRRPPRPRGPTGSCRTAARPPPGALGAGADTFGAGGSVTRNVAVSIRRTTAPDWLRRSTWPVRATSLIAATLFGRQAVQVDEERAAAGQVERVHEVLRATGVERVRPAPVRRSSCASSGSPSSSRRGCGGR